VVQLFTKSGAVDDKPQLSQSFGSYGFRQTTGQVSGRKQAFDYSIQLSTNASNGYDTRPDITHTPNKEGSDKNFGMVKLGYDLNAINRVELVRFKTMQSFRTAPSTSGDNDITNHNTITGTKVEWQSSWGANNLSRMRYTQSVLAADSNDPNSGNDVPWNYKTTVNAVALDHEWSFSVGKLNGLVERKQDAFKADENYWSNSLINTAVDKNRSQNALGLGYSLKHAEYLVNASVRADNYSSFGTHSSYSLSYGYKFQPEWTLIAIQATGFRAPTLEQLHGIYGMATLEPESNISRELALQFRNGKSSARLSFFENTITDLITANESSTNCTNGSYCYYNVNKVKIQGISLSGKTQVSDVNLQTSLDLLNPVYDSGTYAGNQLSLRSKQAMHAAADKQFDATRAGVEFQYVGKRFDVAANTVELPAYNLVNLWTQSSITNEWQWINRIDNLMNKSYQQYGCTSSGVNTCNYAMPGTTFFTAIQWQPK
jgi:vitamin B12 transporter